jgi:hypothetical protein
MSLTMSIVTSEAGTTQATTVPPGSFSMNRRPKVAGAKQPRPSLPGPALQSTTPPRILNHTKEPGDTPVHHCGFGCNGKNLIGRPC